MSDTPNWRANWMDKWGRRVSSFELTEPSKEPKKETQELHPSVDLQLQAHAKYMTEETKNEIRAIMREAQAKAGDSVKLSLAPTKGISRLKRFLNKFLPEKPNGEGVTGTAPSAQESILPPATFHYTRNETVESLVERALKDRQDAGLGASD
jgi:hypothetical protein